MSPGANADNGNASGNFCFPHSHPKERKAPARRGLSFVRIPLPKRLNCGKNVGGQVGHLEETPLAARGNRLVGVSRVAIAVLATAWVGLWSALPARAQEAPPPAADAPAQTTSTTTTSTPAATPAPDAAPSSSSSEPAKADVQAPEATPSTDTATAGTSSSASTAAADEKSPAVTTTTAGTADAKPAETEATPAPKDAVKLEPAAPAAAAAPTTAAPALQPASTSAPTQSAPTQSSSPTQVTIVLVTDDPAAADPAATTTVPSAETAETAAATVVSLRPRPAPSAISLLPMVERTDASVRPAPPRAIPAKTPVRQTCARPTARVPLSVHCIQVRAISALRVRLTYLPSSEVRAAIVRGASRLSIRRVEARPPPKSTAAKKHPVAEARPTVPFGSSGQGAADHSFSSSSGATWSSRVFVLAAPPVRVPRPSRFARLRLPSTIPHGVMAAPPPARPG
jgi:hypothetical protein